MPPRTCRAPARAYPWQPPGRWSATWDATVTAGWSEPPWRPITADPAAEEPVNIPALGEALAARHWHLDRQGPPDGLHLTVSAGNVPTVNEWLADLSAAVVEARERGNIDPADDGSYATLE